MIERFTARRREGLRLRTKTRARSTAVKDREGSRRKRALPALIWSVWRRARAQSAGRSTEGARQPAFWPHDDVAGTRAVASSGQRAASSEQAAWHGAYF